MRIPLRLSNDATILILRDDVQTIECQPFVQSVLHVGTHGTEQLPAIRSWGA